VQSSSDAMDLEQTGRFIARCKYYTFCFVMAAVESLFMPFGTVLAVFTLVVLLRESVKRMFEANKAIMSRAV